MHIVGGVSSVNWGTGGLLTRLATLAPISAPAMFGAAEGSSVAFCPEGKRQDPSLS